MSTLRTKVIRLAPELAKQFLSNRAPNRSIKKRVWQRYASDMAAGRWALTHQGLAFDETGALTDGQHRCIAVEKSGIPIETLATWGLPREAQLDMDQGKKRAAEDVLTIAGTLVDKHAVSIARAMWGAGLRSGLDMSISELRDFIARHSAAITFARVLCDRKVRGVSQATIAAVIARAWYHEDHARLSSFIDVLTTGAQGFPPEDDSAAIQLRNILILASKFAVTHSGSTKRRDVYLKTVRAIELFCARKKTGKLYAASADPYLLPEQEEGMDGGAK